MCMDIIFLDEGCTGIRAASYEQDNTSTISGHSQIIKIIMLVDVVWLNLHTLYYKELTEQLTLVRGGVYLHTMAYGVL